MPDDGLDITAPAGGPSTDLDDLSVHGRVLMDSLEARMFGKDSPTHLGRYHLLETLGRGAMGVVYKAYDPQLDRLVAVKVVTLTGADARARMVREAKALAKLNHPNVVTVYEVGEEGDEMYVAMEYVEGGTLAEWCEARSEPAGERARALIDFALQALDGIAAAHDLGLVHRDIKPANMLVGVDGRLRVADFGLARAFESDAELVTSTEVNIEGGGSTSITRTGAMVGTPAFMALEQFRGIADASSDQFGLCASFFVAFYGVPPYEAKSIAGLLDSLEEGRVVSPPARDVPDYVRRVLLRGLRPRAQERFENVRALTRALRAGARRRRWTVGTGMASVGAAGVAAALWASQPAPCTDDRSQIEAAVAGEPERIAALIEASGRPHPDELGDRFSADLEGIVDRWTQQRIGACRASRDRDPEVAARGQHRMRCLDDAVETTAQALRGIKSLTRAQADALPTVGQFIQGAHDCEDADRETFDSEHGREMLALHRSGLAAEGRLDVEVARTAYEAVLAGTERGQFAELRSEAHTRLASIYERLADKQAFERHLVGSLDEAENAGSAELTALHWLAVADTLPLTESSEAFELLVSRSHRARERGSVSDHILAQLLYMEADIRLARGHFDRVAELLEQAIPVGEAIGSPALPFMYTLQSHVLQRNGQLERAEARAHDAVDTISDQVGEHHPEVAVMLSHLANVQSWRGQDAKTVETYSRVISILEERPDYMSSELFYAYSGRGDALRNTMKLDDALIDYEHAEKVAEGLGEQGVSLLPGVQYARARTYWMMSRHHDALALLDTVLGEADDGSVWRRDNQADSAILRASILADVERDDEALAQLEKALPMVEAAYGVEGAPRVQAACQLADIYSDVGEHERAQAEIERFLPQVKDDPMWRGMLEQSRARDFAEQGRTADARSWAERALASMRESGAGQHELDPIDDLIASLDEAG